jgi:hypothetical protein
MKSAKGKERWRNFIMPVSPSPPVPRSDKWSSRSSTRSRRGAVADPTQYEKKLKDYNFGTLVRKDANRLYEEDNAILVTRVQFFAIEAGLHSYRA